MITEKEMYSLIREYRLQVPAQYMEDVRYYHSNRHIENMFAELLLLRPKLPDSFTELDIECLINAIIWHDAKYDPLAADNEEQSAELFLQDNAQMPHEMKQKIKRLIMVTKNPSEASTELERLMVFLDLLPLTKDVDSVIRDCNNICKEYRCMNYEVFRKGRIAFLSDVLPKWVKDCFEDKSSIVGPGMQQRILEGGKIALTHICNLQPKIGIYVGSFNPIHIGHLDILNQASKVFDKIIIIRATNLSKSDKIYEFPQLLCRKYETADVFDTPINKIVDLYTNSKMASYSLIRGIRSSYDLIEEQNYAQIISDMGVRIPITYFLSKQQHISSTVLRQLDKLNSPLFNVYKV